MNKLKLLLTSLMCFAAVNSQAQTNLLGDKSVITLEEEFRAKDQSTPLFYEHTDLQYKYLATKYFDTFGDYRFILKNNGKGFVDQNMFIAGFNIKYPESRWGKVNLRVREEIALAQSPSVTTWQLNVFPKYNTPWKFTRFKINPFVADESFYDTIHSMGFVRNRIYAGVDWQITSKIKGSTYYYREDAKSNPWAHADVAVTQVKFEF